MQPSIEQAICRQDASFRLCRCEPVGGGSINSAWCYEGERRSYFVKLNSAQNISMFEAEAEGLRELAASRSVRVPQVLCHGVSGDKAYLVCEWLEMGHAGRAAAEAMGCQLAAMHACTRPLFGWHRDNTIGATTQVNTPQDNWVRFWRDQRLGFQFQLGAGKGFASSLLSSGERLMAGLELLLAGHHPEASLLHGDLWGGNWSSTRSSTGSGEPVLFDPAVYYGDSETDLAMTELFGGFPEAFYAAYRDNRSLDAGYPMRRTLYNLYHVLNHANLFDPVGGGSYAAQAEGMIDRLLAEAG